MPEVWAIAYDFEQLVDRKLAETPEEEGIRLAIEREKKEFKPRYTNREEFDHYIRIHGAGSPTSIENKKREEIRRAVWHKTKEEFLKEIGVYSEWNTKNIVDKTISFLKGKKIPFILNVFKNTMDDRKAREEIRNTNERIKKINEPFIDTWVIPDYAEDPPIDGMLSEESVILLTGLLASGASILLSYWIKKGMTV
jgi:hypothetical protein